LTTLEFQIYPLKTGGNWETELGIGSYLNYLTLSKKKDWTKVSCIIYSRSISWAYHATAPRFVQTGISPKNICARWNTSRRVDSSPVAYPARARWITQQRALNDGNWHLGAFPWSFELYSISSHSHESLYE
jgi:hypothetical protein